MSTSSSAVKTLVRFKAAHLYLSQPNHLWKDLTQTNLPPPGLPCNFSPDSRPTLNTLCSSQKDHAPNTAGIIAGACFAAVVLGKYPLILLKLSSGKFYFNLGLIVIWLLYRRRQSKRRVQADEDWEALRDASLNQPPSRGASTNWVQESHQHAPSVSHLEVSKPKPRRSAGHSRYGFPRPPSRSSSPGSRMASTRAYAVENTQRSAANAFMQPSSRAHWPSSGLDVSAISATPRSATILTSNPPASSAGTTPRVEGSEAMQYLKSAYSTSSVGQSPQSPAKSDAFSLHPDRHRAVGFQAKAASVID